MYYYHPDHLGSSSYITDGEGSIIQHTEYMAFGEILFDEHSVNPRQPYLFNGKELDQETGLYYYGARYYDPKTSIWLNVDPLAEKTMTPYAYVNNNPVNLIDPTGMEGEDPKNKIYDSGTIKEVSITGRNKTTIETPTTTVNNTRSNLFYRNWSPEQQANIDRARQRFSEAEQKCEICQEVKSLERVMFVYTPMAVFTGGLSTKTQLSVYAGKAAISISTQGLMNIDRDEEGNLGTSINIMKVTGDTFFNPVSGSILGNSSEINIGIGKNRLNSYKINNQDNVIKGVSVDLLFMGRGRFYEKNRTGKIGETIMEIQSQIITQGMSKGINR